VRSISSQYLRANPQVQRTQTVNGRTQTLVRIDVEGNPVYQAARDGSVASFGSLKNLASGQLIKADSLYLGGSVGVNITGTGMVAGVWEPGIPRVTHELLTGKVTVATGQIPFVVGGDADHASHVTGTMIGRNVATHPSARGIAFDATSTNYDSVNDLTEMTTFAIAGNLISNHSYGDLNTDATPANQWKYGAYDTEAKDWDVLLKNAVFYLPFIAAGNEQTTNGNTGKAGFDIMTGPAVSKNTMTVGAVNGDETMSAYSNWGPTDDGRVKPEIVAKGTGIDSAQSAADNAYSGNGANSSGTSYSSPAAAASGLLLQQYHRAQKGGSMRSSTLKTLMMGTAKDLGQPGPDHKFGYGLLNVEAAALAIKKSAAPFALGTQPALAASKGALVVEFATNPPNDSATDRSFDVYAKGGVPLIINMGWTDDEGPEQLAGEGVDPTTKRLVYDFDMMVRIFTPFADVRPWVVPTMANRTANATNATNWFQANGGNFRQVVIANPVANAPYRIYIRKSSSSPAAPRTLSFVVTGLVENSYTVATATVPAANVNGTVSCADTIVLATNTTTCTAVPVALYRTKSISGCGGTAATVGENTYTTGALTANCTATATFELIPVLVNGACGTANTVATLNAPTANRCADASTPLVTTGAASFTWTCAGSNGGANANCAAPRQYTVTATAGPNGTLSCTNTAVASGGTTTCTAAPATGFVTSSISGCSGAATGSGVNAYSTGAVNADCTVTAAFIAAPVTTITGPTATSTGNATAAISGGGATCGYASGTAQFTTIAPPSGYTLPQGVFQFTANSCTVGGTVTVTLTYPQALPAGTTLWKFGPRPSNPTASWYQHPATISGNTVTYQVTDGGAGDSDGVANGTIVDPAGPVLAAVVPVAVASVPVPTLNEWALMLLALALAGLGWKRARRSM
jgi:serine protease AprX